MTKNILRARSPIRIGIAGILYLGAACATYGASSPFTLEQVMAKPFASDLTAGPGGRVAWIVNVKGVRNVWVAEGPAYNGRQITKFSEDDGQEIGLLRWVPDGRGVIFIRGGDLEHPGSESPNPKNRAEGGEQAVWFAGIDGNPRKLADGGTATTVPGGEKIVFTKGNEICSIPLTGESKPASLVRPRGEVSGITPAPNGRALAFVSTRQDHSFIGIYRFADDTLRYLDPSVDRDIAPAWSPDSQSVAYVRLAAQPVPLAFTPDRSALNPWSIRVANIQTGKGRQIWKAAPGAGSAYHPIVTATLLWAAGNRVVFPWERDGWAHLYSVSIDGGDAALLTPGEFEVEHAALSADAQNVVYSSNQNDVDRRHVWRVPAQPGTLPIRLTQGSGLEWAPVGLDGAVAFLRSDARLPARAAVQTADGSVRDLAPQIIPADFPAALLVQPKPVTFPAADGMPIQGQLFVPPSAANQKLPALIFFHGGSRRQMLLGWHSMYYYNNAYAMNQFLAASGYVVLSVNYRGGIGYGLNFREALDYGPGGASEYNDVIGAGLYMRSRPDVDPKRIGVWGGSYGGYLVALALARGSDLFAAGVDFHGVHDWSKLRTFDSAAARTAFESSPMAAVKTWRSPVLLIHGDDDRNVPFSQTVRLVEALRQRKVDFEELIFPDEIHDFLTHAHWLESYRAAADFLARKLK